MSALSELLRQANTESLTIDKITEVMRSRGHEIGRDTVWKYMSGRHSTAVRTEYLRAFVDLFPTLNLEELQRAASIAPGLGEWRPPPESERLSKREREALDALIKGIVQERERITLHATISNATVGGRKIRAVEGHQEIEVGWAANEARHPVDPQPGITDEPFIDP